MEQKFIIKKNFIMLCRYNDAFFYLEVFFFPFITVSFLGVSSLNKRKMKKII